MLILSLDTSAIASAALLNDDGVLASFATEDTRTHSEVLAPAVRHLLEEAGIDGNDLDAVVVGTGPGPFTGLRVGIATARTLAFVWDVPLHGVMSLEAIALEAFDDAQQRNVPEYLVATDARRQEVYWARYGTAEAAGLQDLPGQKARPYFPSAAVPSMQAVQSTQAVQSVQSGQTTQALPSQPVLPFLPALPTLLEGPAVGAASSLQQLPAYGRGAGLYAELLDAVAGFADVQPTATSLGRVAMARLRAGADLADTAPLYLRESDAKVPGPRKRAL